MDCKAKIELLDHYIKEIHQAWTKVSTHVRYRDRGASTKASELEGNILRMKRQVANFRRELQREG